MQLPPALISSLQNAAGFNLESFVNVHQSGEQVTAVRLNTAKLAGLQPGIVAGATQVPWCSSGYYLDKRPSFTTDPLFHAGAYYVQEASSMFVEQALQQTTCLHRNLRVLDLCAAPGGKSTLLQALVSADSLLVSNEVIKSRVTILAENISKWGGDNVIVTNNDPKDFQRLPQYFDVIVADAPCSGSGLFRKDPAAVAEWSEQNVALCSQRQQRILADVLPSLKHEGVLIYSTCSYSLQEDEGIADWLVGSMHMQSLPLKLEEEWGIVETNSAAHNAYGYRFYPDQLKGEGFFIAAFRKQDTLDEKKSKAKQKAMNEKPTAAETAVVQAALLHADRYDFIKQQEWVLAVKKCFLHDLLLLQETLYIKKAGITLGSVMKQELVPHHDLAMSTAVSREFPLLPLSPADALQYLRKQELSIDTMLKGWALVSFQNIPLGWAKLLQRRMNNYYPKEWRILNK